ncbi:hypothetical protein Trydic_g21296 [Trypoxylus dichotomus]
MSMQGIRRRSRKARNERRSNGDGARMTAEKEQDRSHHRRLYFLEKDKDSNVYVNQARERESTPMENATKLEREDTSTSFHSHLVE